MKNRKFSVIIPVYNCEKYIEKSIYSIINQTYKNWELIIVNDGSTDKTEDKIKKILKENDNRDIKYIFINNSGPATARNKGISLASGDYVCFLDSDDYYENELFEKLNNIEIDYDICYFGWKEIDENNKVIFSYEDKFVYTNGIKSGHEIVLDKLKQKLWLCNCNEVYRLELMNQKKILYPDSIYSAEDSYFIYLNLISAKIVISLKYEGFINRIRKDSLMHATFSERNLTEFKAITMLIDKVEKNNDLFLIEKNELICAFKTMHYYSRVCMAKKIIRSIKFYEYLKYLKKIKLYIVLPLISVKEFSNYLKKKQLLECIIYEKSKIMFFLITKIYDKVKKIKCK